MWVPCAGDQRSSVVNESSSLLGGSPRRQCGRKGSPYHTGQLHPAVRVADLLQHINQMKTAEGYGFKQEYEVRTACASVSGPVGGRVDKEGTWMGPVCQERMLQVWSFGWELQLTALGWHGGCPLVWIKWLLQAALSFVSLSRSLR